MKLVRGKILGLVIMVIVILSGVFISYSKYNKEEVVANSSLVLADEYFSINYKDGNYFDVKHLDSKEALVKHLTITNVTSNTSYVSISLMDINKNNTKLEVKLIDGDKNILYQDYLSNMDTEILRTKEVEAHQTLSYDIIITNLGEEDTYGMSANIMTYKELQKKEQKSFKDIILSNNEVNKMDSTQYLENYTDSGLFMSEDDLGISYIFRGNVSNNYVSLNNILFRILRINGDGTVKLISNSNVLNSSYRSKINSKNYDDNVVLSDSSVLEKLNSWYNANLGNWDNYIVMSNFCNEDDYYLENVDGKYFNAYQRIVNDNTPSLKCGGKITESKVGLINIDEARFSGASLNNTFSEYYLGSTEDNMSFFTMSGSHVVYNYNVVDNFSISSIGKIELDSKVTSSLGIRPVITLDKNVKIDGDGTLEHPFTIANN